MITETKQSEYPSRAVAWTTVAVLSLTYMFSFLDRTILILLIDPIKADLQISDTQVSLLTGFSFAIIYTVMGIPMGRLADLWVRKYVVIFGVTVWSLLTIASGFSRNFGQLFLARMGVGFGEAGLTSPAYAMVADLFPPKRLAFGMSVFVLGGSAGYALSLLLGGLVTGYVESIGSVSLPFIGEIASWRLVLIIAGLASLVVVIPLMLMPEPKRHLEQAVAKEASSDEEKRAVALSFREVLHYLWRCKSFYGLFLFATSLNYAIVFGSGVWIPSYFIRVHGWDAASIGVTLGLIYVVPMMGGNLLSGWLADRLYKKGYHNAPLYFMTISGPLLLLLTLILVYASPIEIKFAAIVLLALISAMHAALTPTAIQMATPRSIRAQVSAVALFIQNIVGLGLGPTLIALVTDYIFRNDLAVGDSIVVVGVVAYLLSTIAFYKSVKSYEQQRKNVSDGVSMLITSELQANGTLNTKT